MAAPGRLEDAGGVWIVSEYGQLKTDKNAIFGGTVTFNGAVSGAGIVGNPTTSLLSAPFGITATVPVAGNVAAITAIQNDTTNNPTAVSITNTTSGNALTVTQSGSAANAASGVVFTRASSVTPANTAHFFQITDSVASGMNACVAISDSNTSNQWNSLNIASVRTAQAVNFTHNPASNGGIPNLVLDGTQTITGAVTDGYHDAIRPKPTYSAATAQTVTRHNYFDLNNVTLSGAGPAALTDAAVFRFNAAAGTHAALAANGSVATSLTSVGPTGAQTTVQGWLKINVNGTLRYVPFF
jgi:hypothetical protein